MRRKERAPDAKPAAMAGGQPVNVIVVVETKRRPRQRKAKEDGHPVLKAALGLALAKRLTRRRKRPLRKRVRRAVRQGRRTVRRSARRVRRALR